MEIPLTGGVINTVVRVGDTVRRPMPTRADFVHRLLRFLADRGWQGAPSFHGIDEEGREILEFIPGRAGTHDAVAAGGDENLVAVAALTRELHDLTAGTRLAGSAEVVCHNDLAPKNTVYRGSGTRWRAVAFVDWDLAAPGARIHDVAHLCWQYIGLGPGFDPAEAGRRTRTVADAYGLEGRADLIDTVLWWQDRCQRGIAAGAESGDLAMARLRDRGVIAEIRACHDWTLAHRDTLNRALSS